MHSVLVKDGPTGDPQRTDPGSSKLRVVDLLATLLVLTAGLNLNGVASMAFSQDRIASLVMLVACFGIIIRIGRKGWSAPSILLLLGLTSYIFFGALFHLTSNNNSDPLRYVATYGGSVAVIWATMSYTSHVAQSRRSMLFAHFVRDVLLVSAAATWASPYLSYIYVNVPQSFDQRASGLFANPNEAGIAAAAALAFVLQFPMKRKLFSWAAAFVAGGAVVLTFSKTAIALTILILTMALAQRLRRVFLVPLLIASALALTGALNPSAVASSVATSNYFQLTGPQQERIIELGMLLSGTIDQDVTTGRLDKWEVAMERIMVNLPLGLGLGSYHSIDGGIGVHNAFLMLWGEGGSIPILLVVSSMSLIAWRALRRPNWGIEIYLLAAIIAQAMSTHGAFGLRFQNLLIGFMLGALLVRISASCERTSNKPPSAPFQSGEARLKKPNARTLWQS